MIKSTLVSLCLIAGFVSGAQAKIYQCPSLHGNYSNDQQVKDSFFWSDKGTQQVDVDTWSGQEVRERPGKFYNYGLVCHAGDKGPYYGVMIPVKASSCKALANNIFECN